MMAASVERPSPFRIWVAAARPATLPAALSPVMVGTALAAAHEQMRLDTAIAALVGAILIQIATNFFNDYADFKKGADTDERLGPARATQKGWLRPEQVLAASVIAFSLAVLVGAYLVYQAGWPVVMIGLASILCGVLYTGGPKPLAYHGLGDVFVLLFFGVVAVCGTYYVQSFSWSNAVFLVSLGVGALITAILVVNNLRDRETDAKAGKGTLVVRYGDFFGRAEYVFLIAAAYLLPVLLWLLAVDTVTVTWLFPLLSLPWAVLGTRRVLKAQGRELNPELGATAKLGLLYSVLLSVGVVL